MMNFYETILYNYFNKFQDVKILNLDNYLNELASSFILDGSGIDWEFVKYHKSFVFDQENINDRNILITNEIKTFLEKNKHIGETIYFNYDHTNFLIFLGMNGLESKINFILENMPGRNYFSVQHFHFIVCQNSYLLDFGYKQP